MKRALVLSGGAVLGAYQVGVLQRVMLEEGHEYDMFCGTSVGALNAAFLSQFSVGQGRTAAVGLIKLWEEKINSSSDIYRHWLLPIIPGLLWRQSLYSSKPLRNLVEQNISYERVKSSGRMLSVAAACLETDEFRYEHENNPQILDWVLASSAFPGILEPIQIENKLWVDGGVKRMTPLGEAIRLGADQIDVIMCSNPSASNVWRSKHKNAITIALRAVSMMSDEMLHTDLQIAGLKNSLARIIDKYKHVQIRVIMPESVLVDDSFNFSCDTITDLIEKGYDDSATRWEDF